MVRQKAAQLRIAKKPPVRVAEAKVRVRVKLIRKAADVRYYIDRPVDIGKDKKIKGMRITVPLPGGGRDTYLVLEVPRATLKQLMERARSAGDIRNWIMSNQNGMVEQYLGFKKRPKSFVFTLSPVPAAGKGVVEAPPLPEKVERLPAVPKATREEVPRPKEIKGGVGLTRETGYKLYPKVGRQKKGLGGEEMPAAPFVFKIADMKIYFNVHFTASQLTRGARKDTYEELMQLFRAAILYHAAQHGLNVAPGSDVFRSTRGAMSKVWDGFERTIQKIIGVAREAERDDLIKYIEGR